MAASPEQRPWRARSPRARARLALALTFASLLALPSAAQSSYATPFVFSTLAANVDPTGLFNPPGVANPWGMAVDADGIVYVADQGDNTIRRITPDGVVTTLAGTAGVHGTTDGPAAAALFWAPEGVAVDPNGNVFVSDTLNNTIRKISPAGNVTTFAGQPVYGTYADGTGRAARFYFPCELAADAAGNLYVADWGNTVIRKITPAGVVTTFAGQAGVSGSADGVGSQALFGGDGPEGLAIDPAGNVYVTDSTNSTIRKITPAGKVSTLAGSAAAVPGSRDGTGAAARFTYPIGIAADASGNVYVTDTYDYTLRKITPDGTVTTLAGKAGVQGNTDGTGSAALFTYPSGVAVGRDGELVVADPGANTIRSGYLPGAPAIATQPRGQTVQAGATAVLGIAAQGGPGLGYRWSLNGVPLDDGGGISGADGATLVVSGATAAQAGTYTCSVSNPQGAVTSLPATLSVVDTRDPGRLIDLSCRAQAGTGASQLIVGFSVGGGGTSGPETVLLRASGPALSAFGVPGPLPDPSLQLDGSSGRLAANDGWKGDPVVDGAATAVGAFAWSDAASADSALVQSLGAGAYTAQIAGASGDTGVALAEIYDDTPFAGFAATSSRLVNLSARVSVGTNADVLIAGFVIGGTTSMTVLIRASGPALLPFGLDGVLPDPQLQLSSHGQVIAVNTGWAGAPQIAAAAAAAGAFSWGGAPTADSALLVTLPPGAYTAEVSGATGDTGLALIEVYAIP